MTDSQLAVSGSRELAYTDIGESDWPCIIFCHGAPITRLHLAYLEDQFLGHELHVVSPDRPGYGRSSPQPGRSVADWPSDIEALANALAFDRFIVVGHSSGGPYAVACAALLPQRVLAAVVLGGVTDMAWPPAWEGYNEMERNLMRMADEDAAVAWCAEHFGAAGEGFLTGSDFAFPEPDNVLSQANMPGLLMSASPRPFARACQHALRTS